MPARHHLVDGMPQAFVVQGRHGVREHGLVGDQRAQHIRRVDALGSIAGHGLQVRRGVRRRVVDRGEQEHRGVGHDRVHAQLKPLGHPAAGVLGEIELLPEPADADVDGFGVRQVLATDSRGGAIGADEQVTGRGAPVREDGDDPTVRAVLVAHELGVEGHHVVEPGQQQPAQLRRSTA